MKRGEIWWAELPKPAGKCPVVLLSRDEAYLVRNLVTVAPLTTRIRNIPVEVPLDERDSVPKKCVVNLDLIMTIEKRILTGKICQLSEDKSKQMDDAIRFALGME